MKIKHIILLSIAFGLSLLYYFINPSQVDFLPKCPLYKTTGYYCPGCGSQRATHELLHLNFMGVFHQNILFFIGLLFILYYFIVEILNKYLHKNIYNYANHPKTPILVLILVFIFWILRNLPYYPFNLLSPN